MEPERKAQLERELESLQKVVWSYKDIMIFFRCGSATAEKKLKYAKAKGAGVPGEKAHVFSDDLIAIETKGKTTREKEIDNRAAEVFGIRPAANPMGVDQVLKGEQA